MEQMMGIEPTLIAWEAIVLPLYDICIYSSLIYGQNRNLCFRFYAIWTKCVFLLAAEAGFEPTNIRVKAVCPYRLATRL